MPNTTHAEHAQPHDAGVTLSLSAQQLKALGLASLPAPGAEVALRATVSPQAKADAPIDTDHDAGAQGVDKEDGDGDADAAGDASAPAVLTLRISGLVLTRTRKAADQVLYGSGD